MTDHKPSGIVFVEIPVLEMDRAKRFYETLLERDMEVQTDMGPSPKARLPFPDDAGVRGHIVEGRPAAAGDGAITHIAVDRSLDTVMDRVRTGGGTVVSDVIEIPLGSYFLARDTEGNTLGLFRY